MGAWIETFPKPERDMDAGRSHPLWVRGLKRHECNRSKRPLKLLPATLTPRWTKSHPLWVRGLKPIFDAQAFVVLSRILYGCVD